MRERRSKEEVEQVLEATAEQLAGAWGMCVRGLEGGWGLFGGGVIAVQDGGLRVWAHIRHIQICVYIYTVRGGCLSSAAVSEELSESAHRHTNTSA